MTLAGLDLAYRLPLAWVAILGDEQEGMCMFKGSGDEDLWLGAGPVCSSEL